ncbi:MAG: nucleotide exchange factor GrpE [Planctomycetota bacterium]
MTRSWWDNEEILGQFHDWLVGTEDEVEAVDDEASAAPDHAPADHGVADHAPADHGVAEQAPADHGVAEQAPAEHGDSMQNNANTPPPTLPEVGLLQMVEAFSAMRHEIKLYTKGARNLEGAVERSLEGLDAASRAFKSVQSKEQQAVDYAALPMVESLIELHESFLRAAPVLHAAYDQLTQAAPARLSEKLDQQLKNQWWWRRWMVRRWHARIRDMVYRGQAETAERELAGFREGFQLIQARLARALAESDIRRLDETGVTVDPTRMTVVELLTDSDLPPETVVEVVRPGYLWGSRVVRYAEVRAVASRKTGGVDTAHVEGGDSGESAESWDEQSEIEARSMTS